MKRTKKSNKKAKNLLRFVLLVICGAVFGMNIYLANANSLVGNKMPMPFGYGAAVVLSGSMEPTFSKGDLILVKKTACYSVGDIVVYQSGEVLVVHRIVAMNGDFYVTQGDANGIADEPINLAEIKGKVHFYIPFLGIVVNFIKSPIGTLLVIVAAVMLLEIPRRREMEKDSEELQKIMDEIKRLKDQI